MIFFLNVINLSWKIFKTTQIYLALEKNCRIRNNANIYSNKTFQMTKWLVNYNN